MTTTSPMKNGLGYVVLYGATSTRHVTYEEAQACMAKHHLSDEYLNQPTARRAFSRSIKDLERSKPDQFAREAEDSPTEDHRVFIHETHVPGTTQFTYDIQTEATLDKRRKRIVTKGPDGALLEQRFAHHNKNLVGDDLRQMARRAVEAMSGISLRGNANVRDTGGIYFVPRAHAKTLATLAAVLDDLKIGYLKTFGVIRGLIEQQSLFASSQLYIESEIRLVEASLNKLTSRVSSAEQLKRRLERLKELLDEYAILTKTADAASQPLQSRLDAAIALADRTIAQLQSKAGPRRQKKSGRPH